MYCRRSSASLLLKYQVHSRHSIKSTPKAEQIISRFGNRDLSQSLRRQSQSQREGNAVGVFTPASAALFVTTGVGLLFYFRYEKQKLLKEREKERQNRQFGRPHVGGPFSLTTATGETFTEKNMLGKWSLVYFGFTNCPDICPAELDKVGSVLDQVETDLDKKILPIFISVDPARDTPERMTRYLADFHPSFVGLAGPYDVTKAACKAYRVYFSTPPNADPKGDYLVDHSIFIYLMDPEGRFVEAFGQNVEADQIVAKIKEEVGGWERENGGKTSL